MNKRIIIVGGIILILLIISFLIWKELARKNYLNNTKKRIAALPKEATVILNKSGFTPKVVTIKAGGAVRWLNESGSQQTVNSDNYPTNKLHKELNFGVFNNSSSVVYTFTKPGNYGYHNQFHHDQEGKIIVEK